MPSGELSSSECSGPAVTFSRNISRIPHLGSLLGIYPVIKKNKFFSKTASVDSDEIVIGWGRKKSASIARQYADHNGLQYLNLEDGFLRSVGLGMNNSPLLSMVIDDLGIYYDATCPSRLENILNGNFSEIPDLPPFSRLKQHGLNSPDPLENEELITRARQCIQQIMENHLSKYNSSSDIMLPITDRPRVLVADQTAGDLSIKYGMAKPESFTQMLDSALAEHPDAEIFVKIHPDTFTGKKQGHLSQAGNHPRVHVIESDCNPISLLKQIDHLFVVTSQLGFEALMLGKTVTCFGAPFYAGWGLTDDRIEISRRRQTRSIEQLFSAAYILYCHYRDPVSGNDCEIENILDHLALQRHYFKENSGTLCCYGFSPWKRGYIRSYLHSPWNKIHFANFAWQIKPDRLKKNGRIIVWGNRINKKVSTMARELKIPVWCMEDGFLRSVGLGSDFTAPVSLVLDKKGIYFDPNRPSDLEEILQRFDFTEKLIRRAKAIRNTLNQFDISKYNVGEKTSLVHTAKPGQRIILVPGQVIDDASIRSGCIDICTNESLLQAVRKQAPDAYIIYKPHPDVLSGNRKGQLLAHTDLKFDQIVTDTDISRCLEAIDEVHTMTSLTGFEALIRGKSVTTYGLPFYAGWGLTHDLHKLERRTRNLSLDALIAGCVIIYPRYKSTNIQSGVFLSPEKVIDALRLQRSNDGFTTCIGPDGASRIFRKISNLLNGLMSTK